MCLWHRHYCTFGTAHCARRRPDGRIGSRGAVGRHHRKPRQGRALLTLVERDMTGSVHDCPSAGPERSLARGSPPFPEPTPRWQGRFPNLIG